MKNTYPFISESGQLIDVKSIQNYFDIYGITSKHLQIDTKELESEYFAISRRIHPDLFSQISVEQHQLSLRYSELLNSGYKVLRNPFKRTKYYLEVNDLLKENKSIPTEVAADVFEIQDILENENLSDTDVSELNQYLDKFKNTEKEYLQKLEQLSDQDDYSDPAFIEVLNKLVSDHAYIQRIFTNIENRLEMIEL